MYKRQGINMVGIASARIRQEMFKNFDLKGELNKAGKTAYKSAHRMAELPDRLAQILEELSLIHIYGDVWLTQKAISQLFDVDRSVITKHLSLSLIHI